MNIAVKTYFDVQENTEDKASKNQCRKYFSQVIVNYGGVENSKPEGYHKTHTQNQAQIYRERNSSKFSLQLM